MDFVWQYIHGPSAWRKMGLFNELEYSIKSVTQNVKDARCIVVGDDPGLDVIHIPGPARVDEHPSKQQQHVDKFYKMQAMLDSDLVGDEFVLMYDDMFILQPTTIEELKINWAKSEVTIIDDYLKSDIRTGSLSYLRIWRATYEFIKMWRDIKKQKTYDWESHTPRYIEKEKLAETLGHFDVHNPKIVTGLYDGFFADNTKLLEEDTLSDLWTHKPGMDFNKEFSRRYLNIYDNVIVPEFVDKMKEVFG